MKSGRVDMKSDWKMKRLAPKFNGRLHTRRCTSSEQDAYDPDNLLLEQHDYDMLEEVVVAWKITPEDTAKDILRSLSDTHLAAFTKQVKKQHEITGNIINTLDHINDNTPETS